MELTLVTFAAMAVVVTMTPGPTVLLALSNGSRYGFARAVYGILAAALSDAVLITAAALGLGAVLAGSAMLFGIVKAVGVAYLAWIGVQMLRSSGGLAETPATGSASGRSKQGAPRQIFQKSFLAAVTNPKGYLFFTAFLPQFLTLDAPLPGQYVILAALFIAVDVLAMCAYAGLGAKALGFLRARGAFWLERVCGGLLVSMAVALAFVRRSAA